MIFIIDDDLLFQFIMKKRIENINKKAEIRFLMNGQEALDVFTGIIGHNGRLPDKVFIDINMPVLDGWQLMDALLELMPDIDKHMTIYLCSTSLDSSDRIKAEGYSIIKKFLIKDIDDETLELIINDK